jgi:hypothetical protein
MKTTVYFRGNRQDARNVMYRLAAMLAGRAADAQLLARGVFYAVGFSVLSDIKDDFIVKSRGGVGADGVKWKPLSQKYLAYQRRFGTGEKASLKKSAGLGKGNRFAPGGMSGLLNAEQLKRWRQIYAQLLARFLLSMPVVEAKAKAAAIAWTRLKADGARTKLEVFGRRQVDIGRDTGILLNSLSPGELTGGAASVVYTKPPGEGGDQQVFDALSNGIMVGTNVAYAAAFHKLRPFLPQGDRMPEEWRQNMLAIASRAIVAAASHLYAQGA